MLLSLSQFAFSGAFSFRGSYFSRPPEARSDPRYAAKVPLEYTLIDWRERKSTVQTLEVKFALRGATGK
jgi:hypothetical protein